MYKPGDVVNLTGCVYAHSGPDGWANENDILPSGYEVVPDVNYVDPKGRKIFRVLVRTDYPDPVQAMILGWSTRQIGRVYSAYISPDTPYGPEEYEPGYLEIDRTFKVWYAMPLDPHQRNRYRKPVTALPEQIQEAQCTSNNC